MNLKFWTWKRKKKKEKLHLDQEKLELYPAKNMSLITTESDLDLKICKVTNDHFIKISGEKKRKRRIMRKPHILTIPLWAILPGYKFKLILARMLLPRFLRFRVYTIRQEGEITHDPHDDNYDQEDKMKLEAMLKLEGQFAAANAGGNVYEGMKGKLKWHDYIPWIIMGIIVIAFLFAFQIAPNIG